MIFATISISLTCFTASYIVALLLEVTRLYFRSGIRGAVMLGFGGAGLLAHTWFLADAAYQSPAGSVPLSNWYHWYLVAAWVLAAMYLYLTYYHSRSAIGLFVLPLVLGLIAVGYFHRGDPSPSANEAAHIWLLIHVVSLLLGTVVVSIGFVAGLMYLLQARQLKQKTPPGQGLRLPSLEWCEKTNASSILISVLFVGLGVVAGWISNADLFRTTGSEGIPWSDPVIWSSALLFGWLLVASLFNFLYRPARQGRKVAYLTVASFLFLALVIAILVFDPNAHSTQSSLDAKALSGVAGGRV